ncbi:MAG: AzlC family ABC transporter permease [Enterococcus sp.]
MEQGVGYIKFVDGIKACIPTMFGYVGIGFAAGVVEKGVGLSFLEIALLSLIVYAGSAQFIICALLAVHAPLGTMIATVFLVNLRHLLMSLSIAHYFKENHWLSNLGLGSLLTDESYGVLVTALTKHQVRPNWLHGLNLSAYVVWLFANLLGGGFGSLIPNPEKLGLDFALTAMFLGLWLFQLRSFLKNHFRKTIIILGVILGTLILLLSITSAEVAVIGATLLGCLVGGELQDA